MNGARSLAPGLALVALLVVAAPAHATLVLPQNLENLEAQAGQIFAGVCTNRSAEIDDSGIPVRRFTFRVTEAVRCRAAVGETIEVRHFGNGVPNEHGYAMHIPGIPDYRVGQEVLLFLNPPSTIGLTAPVGLSQGLFAVKRNREGKATINLDPLRRRLLSRGLEASRYTASEGFTERDRNFLAAPPAQIELDEFCDLVRKMSAERKRRQGLNDAGETRAAAEVAQ
jgi:hypothetical protein